MVEKRDPIILKQPGQTQREGEDEKNVSGGGKFLTSVSLQYIQVVYICRRYSKLKIRSSTYEFEKAGGSFLADPALFTSPTVATLRFSNDDCLLALRVNTQQ